MATWSWRCPDCGGRIHVPLDLHAIAEAVSVGGPLPPLDYDALFDATTRHVAWNPDIHPSFVRYKREA